MKTASKLPDIGTTIFAVMSKLAHDTDAINLAQGFPSFDPPDALLERVTFHLKNGANQYAPANGVPELLNAIAAKIETMHACPVDPEHELTVCTGATEGMFSAITAFVQPGDDVILFDPAYDAYEPAIRLAGGRAVHVPLALDGDRFTIDWQALESALSASVRALVLNFPHNPTGAILSASDLDRLAALLRPYEALVLSDEVYEHIVFDGEQHVSLCAHAELKPKTLVISSFGKTFHATGWKVGYVFAPTELTEEFRKVHQFATFSVNTPVQHALADFMSAHPDYYAELSNFYEQKRDRFVGLLKETKLRYVPTPSTFFQVVDYSAVSDLPDTEAVVLFTEQHGVASIPLSVFCEKPFTGQRLRLCFAKHDAELVEAASRLAQL
jgi:methionine aminotransferase